MISKTVRTGKSTPTRNIVPCRPVKRPLREDVLRLKIANNRTSRGKFGDFLDAICRVGKRIVCCIKG